MASAGRVCLALFVNRLRSRCKDLAFLLLDPDPGAFCEAKRQLFANNFVLPVAGDAIKVRARKWRGFGGN